MGFSFGANLDHDLAPEISEQNFLPLQDRTNRKNFIGLAALAEVCDLQMLSVKSIMVLLFAGFHIPLRSVECLK